MTAAPIRTALVLGGASDIARAVLDRLREDGLEQVVLAVRDPDAAAGVDGLTTHVLAWDALDVDAHATFLDDAFDRLGRIDVVICAVGMLGHHAGLSMGPAAVDEMVRTNFAGPAAALAAVATRLQAQGSGVVVVFSSVAGVRPRRSNYVYGSTKSGLDAFARGMADALSGTGVRVLVVRPGFVRTSMTEGLDPAPFSRSAEAVGAAVAARVLSGRGGVVWVPRVLGPLFSVFANLPGGLWRRIAGDR